MRRPRTARTASGAARLGRATGRSAGRPPDRRRGPPGPPPRRAPARPATARPTPAPGRPRPANPPRGRGGSGGGAGRRRTAAPAVHRPATRAAGCASSPWPACSCSASSVPSWSASRASTPPRSPRRRSSSARRSRSSRRCAARCSPPTAPCSPPAWCARSSSPTSTAVCTYGTRKNKCDPATADGGRAEGGDQARPAAQHHGLRAGARADRHQPLPHPQPRRHPADLEHDRRARDPGHQPRPPRDPLRAHLPAGHDDGRPRRLHDR